MSYKAHWQPLPSKSYCSEVIFTDEMKKIRSNCWSFACLLRDIPNHNDFVTVSIGQASVIVQNFNGEIRAFDNICSHRGCRIRTKPSGNGIIRCPYHSWTYNSAGIPVGVPSMEEAFQLTADDRISLALFPWELDRCGEFVFVRRSNAGASLPEQLGTFFELLFKISSQLGDELQQYDSIYDANWKVCVENTLDEYHARFVHPNTFGGMLSSDFNYFYSENNSLMRVKASEEYFKKWKRIEKYFAEGEFNGDEYFHLSIFPTMTIASSFGASFSVQIVNPLNFDKTLLSSRLFMSSGNIPRSLLKSIGDAAVMFNKTVFDEDREICNQVQLGVRDATRAFLVGKFEQRIIHFQTGIMALPGNLT